MKSSEPKQVLAIEYDGILYPDLAAAETSRARQTLNDLLPKIERGSLSPAYHYFEMERNHTIGELLKHPREVAAAFAKVVAAMGDKR
jgi:hypothetical protein